jgi:F-type H+-transporting ATPase subunit b
MRRVALPLILLGTFAALPVLAADPAAHHDVHGPDWAYFAYHSIGLAILLGVITYFARAPLQAFLRDRSDGIRRQIESAEQALAAARSEAAELRTRLARVAEENEALVAAAAEQADGESVFALERARQAADSIREESRRSADQEITRARRELQAEAARLATTLAGELLRQGMTADDDRRIVGEFVEQIGRRT